MTQRPYLHGFIDGVTLYAWWKDGKQMVGSSCGMTLREAIEDANETPMHPLDKAHDKLVKAVQALLKAHEQLMPGIGHIACSDYAVVNEAPLLAREALADAGVKE